MEPEVFEQEEQPYRDNPRNLFNARLKRKGEEIFKENFGQEIDFEEVREEFNNIEELEEIASMEVKKPSFPFITFYIALVLDILDIADFSGVGWVVMSCIEIIFTILLFVLMFGKTNTIFKGLSRAAFRGGRRKKGSRKRGKSAAQKGLNNAAKKYLKKYISRRLIATLIVNLIPIVGILASNAFFVFLAHNKQSKIAEKYIALVTAVGKMLDRHNR